MTGERHAEVAGAGFAGLTVATALARNGWSVRVHEKSETLRDFGAGILIWRNAMISLEMIGVADRIEAEGLRPRTYDTDLNGVRVSRELEGFPYFAIPRPRLHTLLVEAARAAGVELVTSSEVVAAKAEGALVLADGSEVTADLVIGADGAGSAVRNSLPAFLQSRQKYLDGVARVLVPRPETFRGAEWDRVIDYWTLEPDAMRILFIPCTEELLYMGLMAETKNMRASALPIDAEVWSERFPHLREPIELAARAEGSRHDSYQTNRVSTWSHGRVAIVGDAAHAMCPALGQGASVGIVNAVELALTLADGGDLTAALESWESAQRAVTDAAQRISGEMAATRNMAKGGGFAPEVLEIARYRSPSIPAEIEDRFPLSAV